MMVLGISWLWWALGTFGLVGTGLMLWLAPAVLVQVAKSLLSFFITNRYGNMIAVAIIVFFVADVNRSLRDEHDFAARTATFEQEQKDRDTRIAKETRDEVWTDIANQTAANTATDKEVKEFNHALPPVPHASDNPFRVGTDVCRLRALAGQAGCGPASSPVGVQKTGAVSASVADHPRHGLSAALRRILGRNQKDQGSQRAP